ncbi:MAG: transposase [Methylococcales bacterium]|nr:transposase [Methylococcales bacterium]
MRSQAKEKYTAEFKENAVKRANESSNVAETGRELGVKENTLYNWVYQYSRSSKPDKAVRTDEHLYDELKRLKKENARLKEERDILKKAAAYFARETRFRPPGFRNKAWIIVSPCCVLFCQ